jgi:hypothetical protein
MRLAYEIRRLQQKFSDPRESRDSKHWRLVKGQAFAIAPLIINSSCEGRTLLITKELNKDSELDVCRILKDFLSQDGSWNILIHPPMKHVIPLEPKIPKDVYFFLYHF